MKLVQGFATEKYYINELQAIFLVDLERVWRRAVLKSLDFKLYIRLLNRVD